MIINVNKCIFLLVFSIATAAQPTPQPPTADWSNVTYYPIDAAAAAKKPKPPVPESSVYGAIFMVASLSILGWKKLKSQHYKSNS